MPRPIPRSREHGRLRAFPHRRCRVQALAASGAALASILLLSGNLAAQALAGRVVDSETGAPVTGAFVELLRRDSTRVAGVLTDTAGRFAFPVFHGTVVRAAMIGYARTEVSVDSLRRAATLSINPSAVPLAAITVEGKRRCGRTGDEEAVYAVWDEARKALAVAEWAAVQPELAFIRRTRESVRRVVGNVLVYTRVRVDTVRTGAPYWTIADVDAAAGGLVVLSDGRAVQFFAPGPDHLLSDQFRLRHCFSLVRAGSRLGLRFAAIDETVPDVNGTIWLERSTAALSSIQFTYSGFWTPLRIEAGGRLTFSRTRQGVWYVRLWSLTAPLVNSRASRAWSERALARSTGIVEREGEVKAVLWNGVPQP